VVTAAGPGEQDPSLQPPYLVTASTDHRGVAVAVTADASTAVVEMAVHGMWSPRLGSQVAARLRLCTAGPAASIIVDLHDVGDTYGVSQPFWTRAWRAAWLTSTPARLTLCLPTTTALGSRLRQIRGPRPMLYATMPEARVAVGDWSRRFDRLQTRLTPTPRSVRAARDLVTQACQTWHLPQLHAAQLVVSELVSNAVQHARTDIVVTVLRTGTRLHVAVRDDAARFPHLTEAGSTTQPAALNRRGIGLRLVHAAATAWGAMPTRGGKVVWATIGPNRPLVSTG